LKQVIRMILIATAVVGALAGDAVADGRGGAAREVPAALARADALLGAGRPGDALTVLEEIARRYGDDPLYGWQIADRRGVALLVAGRTVEALPLLETAVARSPLVPEHHRNLADALRRLGRRGRALSEYQQAVELAPTDPVHRLEHAYVLLDFRMWRQAEQEFRMASHLCGCPEAERGLAEALLRQGRPAEAVEPLRRLHGAQPTAEHRRDLLAALQEAGADSGILELLAVVPRDSLAADEAVALVQSEGNLGGEPRHSLAFVAAREEGNRPVAAAGNAVFWGRITLNLLAAGHLADALLAADAAVELAPGVPTYRQNRAAVLQRLGREADARRDLEEIHRMEPAGKE